MTDSIQKNLLDQAKQHLASNDFENAAKSARAVLALDPENSDATDMLKASEAAIGNGSSNDESATKINLKLVAAKVQGAINSAEWAKAEDLITQYLVEYPNIPDAQKILRDVQKARGKYNLQQGQIQRQQQQQRSERTVPRSSGYDPPFTVYKLAAWLVVLVIVAWLAYQFVPGINHWVDCRTAEPMEALLMNCDGFAEDVSNRFR
jgi:hypothetical protein